MSTRSAAARPIAVACAPWWTDTWTRAESSIDAIRARGVLRVGVKQDAPPCGFLALDDAAGWRVAVLRGSVQERDVPELQPRAILVPVESLGEVVEQSSTGPSGFIVRFTSMAPAATTWLRERAR